MRDKALTYAVVVSIVAHLAAVAVIGRTSAARLNASPAAAPVQRMMRVELVRDPDGKPEPAVIKVARPVHPQSEPRVDEQRAPKPPPEPRSVSRPRPLQQPTRAYGTRSAVQPASSPSRPTHVPRTNSGDPGGKLSMGSTSAHGDLGGNWDGGKTPLGWVAGSDSGKGAGSGMGSGIGTPEPPKHADPGPGTRPAPTPPPPPPPPAPKMVSVRVCEVSGMLASKYCQKTDVRTFAEGREPSSTCTKCNAPEPVHINRHADSREAKLIRDCKIRLDGLDEGLDVSVTIGFTVGEDGSVTGVSVIKSSGDRKADRAAVNAVSGRKYEPAMQNGEPRSEKRTVKITIRT